jgi:hypothetical protein
LKKKDDLDRQIIEAESKALRLRKQKRALQKKLRGLGDREEQNIRDLELDEMLAEIPVGEQPETATSPTGFSQVSFGSFGRISPVPSGNA